MKTTVLTLLIALTMFNVVSAQDGSDILYVKTNKLNDSYLGDFVHLDFNHRSFLDRQIDTVIIVIDSKPIKFIEHRKDDGLNNWFAQQYLESVEKIDWHTLRITKSRLDKITKDSLFVTNYLDFYTGETVIPEKGREICAQYSKKMIAEILVSDESHKKKK